MEGDGSDGNAGVDADSGDVDSGSSEEGPPPAFDSALGPVGGPLRAFGPDGGIMDGGGEGELAQKTASSSSTTTAPRPGGKELLYRYDGMDQTEDVTEDSMVDLDSMDPRKEQQLEPRREGGRGARKLRTAFYDLTYPVRLSSVSQ